MSDGNLYTIKKITNPLTGGDSSISVSLCHFNEGASGKCITYTTIKQASKTKDVTFDVAKDGSYYCYVTGENREPGSVYKWKNNDWLLIGAMPVKISGWNFAANNDLYVHTFKSYYDAGEEEDNYLKKWDGTGWTDIGLPPLYYKKMRVDSIEKRSVRYELIPDENGGIYLTIWGGLDRTSFLYKIVNNKWVEWANKRNHIFFPTSNETYSYPRYFENSQAAVYKPKRFWEVRKREYSDIPVEPGLVLPPAYADLLSGYRILYNNNVKCLREKADQYGNCLSDGFDSITVVKTPLKCLLYVDPEDKQTSYAHIELKDYALQFISGADTLYTNLTKQGILYKQGFVKKYIAAKPGQHCTYCDGAGFTGGGTVSSTKKVGKDWVPATRETRRVLTTNGYRYETVTSPGYYKSYEYKTDSKTVSGRKCLKCDFGRIGQTPAKWVILNYSRNNFTGRYSQLWHMKPN